MSEPPMEAGGAGRQWTAAALLLDIAKGMRRWMGVGVFAVLGQAVQLAAGEQRRLRPEEDFSAAAAEKSRALVQWAKREGLDEDVALFLASMGLVIELLCADPKVSP